MWLSFPQQPVDDSKVTQALPCLAPFSTQHTAEHSLYVHAKPFVGCISELHAKTQRNNFLGSFFPERLHFSI